MVPLNLPSFKSVVGHKANLLVNQNTTICCLFGAVAGVAFAKNPFAGSSDLVTVSKISNNYLFFFSGYPFLLQQNKCKQ
jgi:hypothetical protein